VAAAEILSLNDQGTHARRKPGAEAGTSDPTADNQDINSLHRGGWLRF
jgi:hypothetical protein